MEDLDQVSVTFCNQLHEIIASHLSIAVEGLGLVKTYSAQWLALHIIHM